ncbi:MAG TPA: MarP family serine protease [Candidatus Limnocylindria bacterium]|nr:MarP family serine protease [Candidatus Limnocylindria bacterium]
MPDLPINLVDVLAILLVLTAVVLGRRSGFVVQALALAGFAIGIGLLILLAPRVADLLAEIQGPLRAVVVLGGMAAVVLLAQSVGSAIGVGVKRRLGRGLLGGVDNGAGGVFGFARGVFMVWLLGGLLAVLPMPTLAAEARQSLILRVIDTRLPSPVVLAAEFGRIIEAAGLPDVFVGPAPAPAEPVDGPAFAEAQAIAEPARESTLRVEAAACARFMTGTGFAVGPSHFVTNAHVVAGSTRVQLSFDGRFERYEGVLVHFDPDLDVAVVYAPLLGLEPLSLAAEDPPRGERMAALGFTGGGSQRVIPAAVTRTLDALGRDIYGQGMVTRPVIEMRASVAPGDSGGPVLGDDGTVGGVTFSESRQDPDIGYALSPVAVADSIRGSLDQRTAVESGECLPD